MIEWSMENGERQRATAKTNSFVICDLLILL